MKPFQPISANQRPSMLDASDPGRQAEHLLLPHLCSSPTSVSYSPGSGHEYAAPSSQRGQRFCHRHHRQRAGFRCESGGRALLAHEGWRTPGAEQRVRSLEGGRPVVILAMGLTPEQDGSGEGHLRWPRCSAAYPRESLTSVWQFPVYRMGAVGGSQKAPP